VAARGPRASVATAEEAMAFVRTHGVVLESALGPVPSLAAAIAGEPLGGSWWGHPQGRAIFALSRAVRDCGDVLVCRLVGGKVTFVDRRLWPALVRVADRFPRRHLARVREAHTAAGRHALTEQPFPDWVSAELAAEAAALDEQAAIRALGPWCAP
jgi:hypothetical protein